MLQNITDFISKGILENISSYFSKKNTESDSKNAEQDSDEELSNRMSKLSINKATLQGI